MNGWDREKIGFWIGLAGGASSLTALSYILWQHRKNQESFDKQDTLLQQVNQEVRAIRQIDRRLRNLELSECEKPSTRENPSLARLLNCPAPPPTQPVSGPGTLGTPGVGAHVRSHHYGGQPMLPNYGFFGDGPAGMTTPIQMPAFQTGGQPNAVPMPFR